MADPRRFDPDLEWLDLVRPVGLVVASSLLKELGLVPQLQTRADNAEVAELLGPEEEDGPALLNPWDFVERILGWTAPRAAGAPAGPPLPEDLCKTLPEYDTVLEPHWAMGWLDGGWQLLARIEAPGVKPDARGVLAGWEATPHQRFERLLRETGIPIGVLITDNELRLVYAPRGETSGWIGFPLRPLGTVAGRPILGGLKLMLDGFRLFNDAEDRRLPALLKASREAQAAVSTALAEQVVGALHELLRGLTAAEPDLIRNLAAERPQYLYEGLLTVLMRLVFVLYAEDRDLIPSRVDAQARAFYEQGYSVRGLHGKLLEDQARHPDAMEERLGAWGRLIALFRLVHAGDPTGWIRARGGKLFDPNSFPFLEGRWSHEETPRITRVTDGYVLRVLDGLLTLKGEQLSYRTLDVEQIGSVYETVMGFTVLRASGPVLAIRAGKHNRTPIFVDLEELAAQKPDERLKHLKEGVQRSQLSARQQQAINAATDVDGMAVALDGIVDERGSPDKRIVPAGTPILQPTDERRRTGSHYTPRSLTEPIVRHALEPAFERLDADARPEQVLDLKICDPAMGSGAFLVEACRALAARLMQAWGRWPETRPALPPDEDEELHARRLVAQRCLYGVDKNPMATDLAKLSLWLATLAREHEFTFLDHALKTGDSLVGLARAQIAALHWDTSKPGLPLFRTLIRDRFEAALAGRIEIRDAPDDVERSVQEARYHQTERRLSDARLLGDAVIAAFFSAATPREREAKRQEIESWLNQPAQQMWDKVGALAQVPRKRAQPIPPFHWELEFAEVFACEQPGFDALICNPPFLSGSRTSQLHGAMYFEWLLSAFVGAKHQCDLVAFFARRTFQLLRERGAVGMIATKTIFQGDTRESSIAQIYETGGLAYRVRRRLEWPGDASVVICIIHFSRNYHPKSFRIDGRKVSRISAYLLEGEIDGTPQRLVNTPYFSKGSQPYGQGFVFDDNDMKANPISALDEIKNDPMEAKYLFPMYGGVDLNQSATLIPSKWIIDVSSIASEDDLRKHERVFEILDRKVRPEREALPNNKNNIPLKRRWWAYQAHRPELYRRLAQKIRVLAHAEVSPYLAFRFVSTSAIYIKTVIVLDLDSNAGFSTVQCRAHELWARFFASTLEDRLRYTPSDCFETFPLPEGYRTCPALEEVGQTYDEQRGALMAERNEGMTKTYNRFHDRRETAPDIVRLRELHAEMDRAVLRAYGWDDLAERAEARSLDEASEDDHKYQGRLFWPVEFRGEVLARLLALNAERSAAERAAGSPPSRGQTRMKSMRMAEPEPPQE